MGTLTGAFFMPIVTSYKQRGQDMIAILILLVVLIQVCFMVAYARHEIMISELNLKSHTHYYIMESIRGDWDIDYKLVEGY